MPAAEVFRRDSEMLRASHLVVAEISEPSSGVGAELAISAVCGIPVIALCRQGSTVSRFLRGLLLAHGVEMITYADKFDALDQLACWLLRNRDETLEQCRR